MGYDYDAIGERTWPELNALQLGFAVQQERKADAVGSPPASSYSGERKRNHERDITRRLRELEV